MAVLSDGVAQTVAHHGKLIAVLLVRVVLQVLVDLTKCLRAIIVVGVDHGKGTFHHFTGGQDSVGRVPQGFTRPSGTV